ncbi:hypothetical protein LTR62_007391 [Meristemomyces frigidus]|uniref:Translation initiation factor eIF2B subunit beta n=1 Tax=Meristemomyces frigidus TaxID=1508187 RepID=A0AAN7TVG5_9PEZI|nr:hypothetical protein LTR62_007391 [Meristemomyces frigidus]
MPSATAIHSPSLSTVLKNLKTNDTESSIELLISLLKRRQIRNSRQCALATIHLFRSIVAEERVRDAAKLIERIRSVGRRLIAAQPREFAVGNLVRRVLDVIREITEDNDASSVGSDILGPSTPTTPGFAADARRAHMPRAFADLTPLQAALPETTSTTHYAPHGTLDAFPDDFRPQRPGLMTSTTSYAAQGPSLTSLFSILQHPAGRSPAGSTGMSTPIMNSPTMKPSPQRPGTSSSTGPKQAEKIDLKGEVLNGINELIDELETVDTQISESALDHVHANEIILTHGTSQTVQKFLLTAARKRKFTVFIAEDYPNNHSTTHATIVNGATVSDSDSDTDERWKPLTSLGTTVVLVPDSAVFALMSRVNKVILSPQAVLSNGSLLAASGTSTITLAARAHNVPVLVLAGVYKLSPIYPYDVDELIEYGDPSRVIGFESTGKNGMGEVEVVNPLYDFVGVEDVDLFVLSTGSVAPSYLYRVVDDHYCKEDADLGVGK